MFDSPPEHDAPPGALRVSAPEPVSVTGVGAGLLEVRGLTVGFPTLRGILLAADHVDLALSPSQTLGIVGESGCGKSVTLRAIMDMVPKPGEILSGEVVWRGRSIVGPGASGMESVRGREITMIFQDAGAALNPVYSVGSQLSEVLRVRLGLSRKEAAERAVGLLRSVGIPSPAERARDYPHQLSGGMRQRVMIAMAVAPGPKLLLADEPTTAVDVTVQQQILALLVELQEQTGMAVILVSHDLAVIGETCDTVAVMYAGHVVERGSARRGDRVAAPPLHEGLARRRAGVRSRGAPVMPRDDRGPPARSRRPAAGLPVPGALPAVRPACRDVSMVLDREWPGHGSACPFVESDR